jgi:hypothetical protein
MSRIQFLQQQKNDQFRRIEKAVEAFWEIAEFQKMAGVGLVNSQMISAYIQNSHRLAHKGQLIKFSQLAANSATKNSRKPVTAA